MSLIENNKIRTFTPLFNIAGNPDDLKKDEGIPTGGTPIKPNSEVPKADAAGAANVAEANALKQLQENENALLSPATKTLNTQLEAIDPQVRVLGDVTGYGDIINKDVVLKVAEYQRAFGPMIEKALAARKEFIAEMEKRIANGDKVPFDFTPAQEVPERKDHWVNPALRADKVGCELTGPGNKARMVIHGANTPNLTHHMIDNEDSASYKFQEFLDTFRTLKARADGTLSDPGDGKDKKPMTLNKEISTQMLRTRGLHEAMKEYRVVVDGKAVDGAIFDAVLYLYHMGETLSKKDGGVFFYNPKLQGPKGAAMWKAFYDKAEQDPAFKIQAREDGKPVIQASALIETFPALVQLPEFVKAYGDRLAVLNTGRYDYQFDFIKSNSSNKNLKLPGRDDLGFNTNGAIFYDVYKNQVCERMGIVGVGGMYAGVIRELKEEPKKPADETNKEAMAKYKKEHAEWTTIKEEREIALEKIRADKMGEIARGNLCRAWGANPFSAELVGKVFLDAKEKGELKWNPDYEKKVVSGADVLDYPNATDKPISKEVLDAHTYASLEYMGPWLNAIGCVESVGRMEDMATAEINRALLWTWNHNGVSLNDGTPIDIETIRDSIDRSLQKLLKKWEFKKDGSKAYNQNGKPLTYFFKKAKELLLGITASNKFTGFLSDVMMPEVLGEFSPAAKLRFDYVQARKAV